MQAILQKKKTITTRNAFVVVAVSLVSFDFLYFNSFYFMLGLREFDWVMKIEAQRIWKNNEKKLWLKGRLIQLAINQLIFCIWTHQISNKWLEISWTNERTEKKIIKWYDNYTNFLKTTLKLFVNEAMFWSIWQ